MCGRNLLKGVGDPSSVYGKMTPGVGVRGKIYLFCTVSLAFWVLVWGLVALGYVAPAPADDYAAITTFFALWLSLGAFVDNKGEKRSWEQKAEEFIYVWLLTSGLAQVFWELPFVLIKTTYLHPIKSTETLQPDELHLWGFWLYGSGDTRYMRFHPESHATETMLAISGPFELAAAYWLATGQRYKLSLSIAALTHWGFFWANTSVIYIAEIYGGFQWMADGWIGKWVKWGGMNSQWSVLSPLCTILCLLLIIGKAREEGRQEAITTSKKQ